MVGSRSPREWYQVVSSCTALCGLMLTINRHPWKGNVAFMISRKPTDSNAKRFRDADATDFRDIVDFLSVCQRLQLADDDQHVPNERGRKVKIVNFSAERGNDGGPWTTMKSHLVPKDHPLLRGQGIIRDWGTPLAISQHIELPMYALRQNSYLRTSNQDSPMPGRDYEWCDLMVRGLIDPPTTQIVIRGAENDRWATGYENNVSMSVVFARADQKDLREYDLTALRSWIMKTPLLRMQRPLYTWWKHKKSYPMFWKEKKYGKLKITPKDFQKAWHKEEERRLARRVAQNPPLPLEFLPCPYELE